MHRTHRQICGQSFCQICGVRKQSSLYTKFLNDRTPSDSSLIMVWKESEAERQRRERPWRAALFMLNSSFIRPIVTTYTSNISTEIMCLIIFAVCHCLVNYQLDEHLRLSCDWQSRLTAIVCFQYKQT